MSKNGVKRSTVQSWGYNWLEVKTSLITNGHEVATSVVCSLCTKFAEKIKSVRNFNHAWVHGTKNVKKDTIVTHLKGEPHKLAEMLQRDEFFKEKGKSVIESSAIGKALNKMKSVDEDKMSKLFDIAFLIAKEEMAFTKFASLARLEKKHGVELGDTYLNDHYCAEFIDAIADIYAEELNDTLNKVNFFSLLIDGSTDSSKKEKELMYVIYIDPKTGRQTMRFLSLKQIIPPLHANAHGLVATIKAVFESHDLTDRLENMIGLGVDGASVNLGARGGVFTLLREGGILWLIAVHCISHRLELGLKDALSKQPVFNDIEDMLLKIYLIYDNSPKKMRQLQGLAEALETSVSAPTKSQGTRWIEHKVRALQWVSKNYRILIEHLLHMSVDNTFKKEDQAKFNGFYNLYRDSKFPIFIEYYLEILAPAALLSQQFQKQDIDIVVAIRQIQKFFRLMGKLISTAEILVTSGRVNALLKSLQPFTEVPTNRSETRNHTRDQDTISYKYREIHITHLDRAQNMLANHNQAIIQSVDDCFRTRFANMLEEDGVFASAVKLLDTELYPTLESDAFLEYGRKEINIVVEHFGAALSSVGCDIHNMAEEWEDAKKLVVDTGLHSLEYRGVWAKLFTSSKKCQLSNILALIEILLVLPVSNATLERGFSCMNRIHTDWRNKLGEKRVENLMRIQIEGPAEPALFECRPALIKWMAQCDRRTNTKPYGPRRRPTDPTDSLSHTVTKLPKSDIMSSVLSRIDVHAIDE